jgi:glucokinase
LSAAGPLSDAEGSPCCLAVDVGGTKLAVGLVDRGAGVLHQAQRPTPRSGDGEVIFSVLSELVGSVRSQAAGRGLALAACGVGIGGPMAPGGSEVSPLNIVSWRGFPLRSRLEALPFLQGIPVYIDNDAKALALAEAWAGAGRGERDFLAMVVSTGIGGGIFLDGRLLEGRSGNAGHIGHLVVESEGRPCRCGAVGCLEAETSGSAIEEITGRPAEQAPPEIVERAGTLVGRAVAYTANLLDLRLCLCGGSVALGYGDAFFDAAQAELDARARILHARGCRIERVGLGALAPIVGAGAIGWRGVGHLGLAPERAS